MFVMIWPDADKAYNFCCDRDKVAFIPRPVQAQAPPQAATPKETLATPSPDEEHPVHPGLSRLVHLTPRERFSQCMNLMLDALLKHPDAYRAVQLAIRHWRDGPLASG